MSALDNELAKYKKKGFKISQRRTLKHGRRFYLFKKQSGLGGALGGFHGIYLYYVDASANGRNITEFLKDYTKFYEKEDFGKGDKGLFICSGKIDKGLFKDLQNALVKDSDVRSSIKTKALPRVTVTRKERITEGKITRRKVAEEHISVRGLLRKIEKFEPPTRPKREKQLENMLISYLQAFYDVRTQLTYERARIDAKIGTTGIEIKYQPSAGDFDRLYGQVEKYLKHLDDVIVVIGSEKSKELTKYFKKRLKERGWLNKRAFVTTL